MDFFKQNGVYTIYAAVIIAVFAAWMIFANKRNKQKKNVYFEQHPDAAKVYLATKIGIASEAVRVLSVNGESPVLFTEGIKSGFYVKPGRASIEVMYSHTRPGVLYRNVTESTGNVPLQIDAEPGKTYRLAFDRSSEGFIFEEASPSEL